MTIAPGPGARDAPSIATAAGLACPTDRASRSPSDGVRHRLRRLRRRRPDDRAPPVGADRPLAPVEGARSRTSAAAGAWSRTTAAATAARIGRPTRTPTPTTGWSTTSRPSWTRRTRTRAVLVGLCVDGVWRSIRFAAAHPERVLGIVAFAVGVPRLAPPHPHYAVGVTRSTTSCRPTKAGRSSTATTGGATTPASPGSSSRRSRPSRTRRRRSRTRSAGRSTARSRRCSPRATRPFDIDRRGGRGDLPGGRAARCSSSTAPRTTASRSPGPSGSPS